MPALNVTAVLASRMFQDTTLLVTRSVETVGDDGIAVAQRSTQPFTGVVTAGRGRQFERTPEGQVIGGGIKIATTFGLQVADNGQIADIVTWSGRQYTVKRIFDWSTFGPGFCCAECELLPLSGNPQP